MKLKRWLLGMLAVGVAGLMVPAVQVRAFSAENVYVSNFAADYYLQTQEDGTSKLHVKEILTVQFPQYENKHGITRVIPRTNQGGTNKVVNGEVSLNLAVQRNGQPESIDGIEEAEDSYAVYIGDPNKYVQGTQVYTIEYDFTDVITEFSEAGENVSGRTEMLESWQELYWDTNGTGSELKFDEVVANLHLEGAARDRLKGVPSCYVGAYGSPSQNDCEVRETSDGFSFETKGLGSGENLTFAVQFEPETFKVVVEKSYVLVVILGVEIGVGLVISGFLVWKWRKSARKTQKLYEESPIVTRYLPPKDLSVAEGAMLYTKKVKATYVATLLEMVIKKKIALKNTDGKHWAVVLKVAPEDLTSPERAVIRIVAYRRPLRQGKEIPIERHQATRELANYGLAYDDETRKELIRKGYLRPEKSRFRISGKAVVAIFVLIWVVMSVMLVMGGELLDVLQPSENAEIVGGVGILWAILIILGILITVQAWLGKKIGIFSRYTEKGVKMARYLDGLEQYIKLAEESRLEFLQSMTGAELTEEKTARLYEKLLPWACIFGVEKSWAKELEQYYEAASGEEQTKMSWAINQPLLEGIMAGNLVGQLNNAMRLSTYYANSSSTSSGVGSRGFSGGGGGGGSVGSW